MTAQLTFTGDFFIQGHASDCETATVTTEVGTNAPEDFAQFFQHIVNFHQGDKVSKNKRTYDDIEYETVEDVLLDFPENFTVTNSEDGDAELDMKRLSFISQIHN